MRGIWVKNRPEVPWSEIEKSSKERTGKIAAAASMWDGDGNEHQTLQKKGGRSKIAAAGKRIGEKPGGAQDVGKRNKEGRLEI